MTGKNRIFVSVLDAIAHGPFFNEQFIWEKTGVKKFDIEKMINDITSGSRNAAVCNKTDDPELFAMIMKSLALLTMFPHEHDAEIANYTKCPKSCLKGILDARWGHPVTNQDYDEILNL